MVRAVTPPRISAEELSAIAKVMRENGIRDLASGDTRIIIDPNARVIGTVMTDEPLRPFGPPMSADDDEDDVDNPDGMLRRSVT